MKKLILIIIIALTPVITHSVEQLTGNFLMNAYQEFKKYKQGNPAADQGGAGFYIGYVSGISSALKMSGQICPSDEVNNNQLAAIIGKHLEENTVRLALPAYFLSEVALINAFPCN